MATIIGSGLEIYIHRNAREQALNRIVEANERAGQILEQVSQQIALQRGSIEAQAQKRIAQDRRRCLAQAHLKANRTMVQRREELFERIWRGAEAQLARMVDREERLRILKRLVEDAAEQLGGGPLEIQTNAQDTGLLAVRGTAPNDAPVIEDLRAHLDSRLAIGEIEIADEPAPIMGGAIVRRLGTHQLVDNSYDRRLVQAQNDLRVQVYDRLIAENGSAEGSGAVRGTAPIDAHPTNSRLRQEG